MYKKKRIRLQMDSSDQRLPAGAHTTDATPGRRLKRRNLHSGVAYTGYTPGLKNANFKKMSAHVSLA
jgi:hypothetical protein